MRITSKTAVTIELDANEADELAVWLHTVGAHHSSGVPYSLWDTLKNVAVNEEVIR
jgi:hypothetical protein